MKSTTKQTLAIYWAHARRYRGLGSVIVLAITGGVVMESLIPLYFKQFFDTLAAAGGASDAAAASLLGTLLTILAFNGVMWLLWRVATLLNCEFQPQVMADLANTCFTYLHGHGQGFFVNRFIGSLVRRVGRFVDAFESVADRIFWDLLPITVRILVVLVVLATRHLLLAGLLVGWVVLYLAINTAYSLYKLRFDTERAAADTAVTARLADTFTNQANIKHFSALTHERRRFHALTERQRVITRFSWRLNSWSEAIQGGLMILMEFAALALTVHLWRQGQATIGDFVLVQAFLLQIFHRLWDFGRIIRDLYRRFADAAEMTEILQLPHEVQDTLAAKPLAVAHGRIEFTRVSFTYANTRTVIRNFSLAIAPGEKVGLVGPSGAGKSTLVALLLRAYDLERGAITIDGTNIADVTQESLRASIGYVPQDPVLFHRSLEENIAYGRRNAAPAEIRAAAKAAHCDEFIRDLPDGYGTLVGERGVKLSGGERQRVAIARAILKNAPILLLDEATSSLDSQSEALIQDALAKLMQGKTVIVIAHRLSTIMKMNRIVVVEQGKISEVGTHAELVAKRGGLYARLWALQAGGFIQ